jgi:MerR family transcriptional regulator, light-induced transcriptional regulator
MTGIKAHTLRIWEKRYSFLQPKRKESSHRYYDNEDLKYILKISFLYHNGHKISKIAFEKKTAIDELLFKEDNKKPSPQLYITKLISAAIDFDEFSFEDVLSQAFEKFGLEPCIKNIVYPYFEKVGLLWMTDNAIPAQEHFSSNMIRNKLIMAIDALKPPVKDRKNLVLLFTPEGEFHEIPLLFAAYLFKKSNKYFIYAGANISTEALEVISNSLHPSLLYFHLITNFTKHSINDYLESLSKKFPGKKIVMSGPLHKQVTKTFGNLCILKTMEEKISYITS